MESISKRQETECTYFNSKERENVNAFDIVSDLTPGPGCSKHWLKLTNG
jgi:hypothetical protein